MANFVLRLPAWSVALRHTAGRALLASGASSASSTRRTGSASSGIAVSGSARNWALQLWQRSALLALIASQALHSLRFKDDEHDEQDSSPTPLSCPHARHLRVAIVSNRCRQNRRLVLERFLISVG